MEFDINNLDDVLFTINGNGNTFLSLADADGNELVKGTDYAVNGSQYRINKSYLSTLQAGKHEFTASFTNGYTLSLNVISSSVQASIVYGDANCDNIVDLADAVAIIQHIGNEDKYGLTEQELANADTNNDGRITGADAIIIQKIEAGIFQITDLPINS